jgi:hypothetical protein
MKRLFKVVHIYFCNTLLLAVLVGAMASCNSVLDFNQGDCTYQYKVKFKYDYNMDFADAFHSLVKTVTLYAFDENGNYVTQATGSGDELKANDYAMTLNGLTPGKYHFVTWAGLDDQSFAVPLLNTGSKLAAANVKTLRNTASLPAPGTKADASEEGKYTVTHELASLWHGELDNVDVLAEAHTRARDTIITIPLIKNTNNIRITIAQASKSVNYTASTRADFTTDLFSYDMYDNNGWMNYDNTLLTDNTLTYLPFSYENGTITTRALTNTTDATYKTATAEISTARLLDTQKPIINIKAKDSGTKFTSYR